LHTFTTKGYNKKYTWKRDRNVEFDDVNRAGDIVTLKDAYPRDVDEPGLYMQARVHGLQCNTDDAVSSSAPCCHHAVRQT